jgi:hypothetical protein
MAVQKVGSQWHSSLTGHFYSSAAGEIEVREKLPTLEEPQIFSQHIVVARGE